MIRISNKRCLGSHKTIGIEGNRKFVLGTPLLAEVPNVARLKARVDGTSAISHRDAAVPDIGQLREAFLSTTAICGSLVSLNTYTWKRSANPELSRPANNGRRLRIIRSGNSLRMQSRMAVDATMGSSP